MQGVGWLRRGRLEPLLMSWVYGIANPVASLSTMEER